eukprot:m.23984 g.23984  ORF g.23984 m.23984 type:complete len:392 (+) comp13283_c0_seq2:24-1199(+)
MRWSIPLLLRAAYTRPTTTHTCPTHARGSVSLWRRLCSTDVAALPRHPLAQAASIEEVNVVIKQFVETKPQSGHVKWIKSALEHIDTKQLSPTLDTYDALLSVFPQDGRFRNKSLLDTIWPKRTIQSECALEVLDRMEDNGVIPEASTNEILLRTFGRGSGPVEKCRRMAYWLRRYSFTNPFAFPEGANSPRKRLALLANRLGGPRSHVVEIESSDENFAIFSAQSSRQESRLAELCSPSSIFEVQGPYYVWCMQRKCPYFILVAQAPASEVLSVCVADYLHLFETQPKFHHTSKKPMTTTNASLSTLSASTTKTTSDSCDTVTPTTSELDDGNRHENNELPFRDQQEELTRLAVQAWLRELEEKVPDLGDALVSLQLRFGPQEEDEGEES